MATHSCVLAWKIPCTIHGVAKNPGMTEHAYTDNLCRDGDYQIQSERWVSSRLLAANVKETWLLVGLLKAGTKLPRIFVFILVCLFWYLFWNTFSPFLFPSVPSKFHEQNEDTIRKWLVFFFFSHSCTCRPYLALSLPELLDENLWQPNKLICSLLKQMCLPSIPKHRTVFFSNQSVWFPSVVKMLKFMKI